ncbi:MAG: TIM barrel protein [Streptosporangiales bacterium]|nr:TIM barrel protein [Streptosporangiales bacterium]
MIRTNLADNQELRSCACLPVEAGEEGTVSEDLLVGATWSCPTQDLLTALETLGRVGFREVEVWAEGYHLDPRVAPNVPAVRERLDRLSLSVRSVHLPFEHVLPAAPAADRARAWVRLCARTLEYAEMLGAGIAVAHPVLFADAGECHAHAVDRFVSAADVIGAHAEERGIQLALENMHTLRGPTLRSVAELVVVLGRMTRGAGVCVDVGHAVFNGFVDDRLAGEIVPGDGIVNWPSALAAYRSIGYAGRHVVEVEGGDDPLANLTRARAHLLGAMSV